MALRERIFALQEDRIDRFLIHVLDYTARSLVPATHFSLFRKVHLKDDQPELFPGFIP
jgi:hypothetical protein